jgi:toxin ParE1/3/4
MKRLVITPVARDDLLAIGAYIADDNPARALSYADELEAKTREIAARPASFPKRDDISPGLRAAVHGRYLLRFRDLDDEVRIVRVIHGARDLHRVTDLGRTV